jgi:hypothetical protein
MPDWQEKKKHLASCIASPITTNHSLLQPFDSREYHISMALRRQIRLRKEFLHKKEVDRVQSEKDDRKRKVADAIDQGKSIPTEIVNEARALHHETEMDVVPLGDKVAGKIDDLSRRSLRCFFWGEK